MHRDDVIGLIDAEELHGAVLVGHSYGGSVITRVADALLARAQAAPAAPAPLAALVYVDAMVPMPGESWSSAHDPQFVAERLALAAAAHAALAQRGYARIGIDHFGLWVDDLDGASRQVIDAGAVSMGSHQPGDKAFYEAKFLSPDGIVFDLSHTGWPGSAKAATDGD